MIFVKNGIFFHLSIFGKVGQQNVFHYILERKTPFRTIKTRSSKIRKIGIFSEVSPWFLSKLAVHFFYFRQNIPQKWVSRNSRKKKRLSRPKKQQLQKIKKIGILPNGLIRGFGQKLAIFLSFHFRQKKARKMCLTVF